MADALLVLKIVTDAKDAAKGLDDASDSVGGWNSNLNKAAAVAGVAAGAVVAFGVSAAQAAAEDAKGQALLAQSLKNATGARDSDVASVEDWITATARATGVADDQLRPAMATLARATGDVATSQDAMSVALDVSAATGVDLQSVTNALAKAYAGNTASLGKLVPGMDKATLASGDMNAIMAELARTTGGSAAAAADTAAGKMERTKLAMDETKESIGAALLPAFAALAQIMMTVATWAQDHATLFTILLGIIGGLAVVVMGYSVAQSIASAATAVWTAAQWLLNAAFWASPITWIVVGVVALIAVIVIIATKTTWFQDIWSAAWDAIRGAAQAVWNWISSNWPLILAILTGPVGLAVLFIVNHLDDITGAARAVWSFLTGAFTSVWGAIQSTAASALDAILNPIHALETAFNRVVDAVKTVIDWIGRIKIPDVGSIVSKLNPFAASAVPTAMGAPSVGLFGAAPRASGGGGGGGPTIIIQGAIDPVATAEQIRRILRDDTRRRGGVRVGYA